MIIISHTPETDMLNLIFWRCHESKEFPLHCKIPWLHLASVTLYNTRCCSADGLLWMSGSDVSITDDCIYASVVFCFQTITVSWIRLFLIPLLLYLRMIFTVLLNDRRLIVLHFVPLDGLCYSTLLYTSCILTPLTSLKESPVQQASQLIRCIKPKVLKCASK